MKDAIKYILGAIAIDIVLYMTLVIIMIMR